MNIDQIKEKHNLYIGFLSYSTGNCKNAFKYLCEANQQLNDAWQLGETSKLNDLGQRDRVFKDYLILKIAGLFDKHEDTLSLPNFASFLEREFSDGNQFSQYLEKINNNYKDIVEKIITNRHKVVAHTDHKELSNLIHTQDLLDMPILELLKEIENLLATVSSPTFPVGQKPRNII